MSTYAEREAQMNANRVNTGKGYWLAWFLASIVGYGVGAFVGISSAWRFFPAGNFGLTMGTVMGVTGGYFQWVVLRERIAGVSLWVLVNALGLGAAIGTIFATDQANNAMAGMVILGSVFGVVGGILQWLILRGKLARSGWWLLANLFGSMIGAIALPIASPMLEPGQRELGMMTLGLLFGAGNGAITGTALLWLLRQSPSNDVEGLATAQ